MTFLHRPKNLIVTCQWSVSSLAIGPSTLQIVSSSFAAYSLPLRHKNGWRRVSPNVQFYTKCAVLILNCAVLAAHLYSYNLWQSDTQVVLLHMWPFKTIPRSRSDSPVCYFTEFQCGIRILSSSKCTKNPFSAGDLLRTPLKELTTPPRSRSRGEEDIPSHSPPLYAFGVSISAPTVLYSPDIFLRKNPGLMQLLASTCLCEVVGLLVVQFMRNRNVCLLNHTRHLGIHRAHTLTSTNNRTIITIVCSTLAYGHVACSLCDNTTCPTRFTARFIWRSVHLHTRIYISYQIPGPEKTRFFI